MLADLSGFYMLAKARAFSSSTAEGSAFYGSGYIAGF
jgi:hypothetical protein